MMRTTTTRRAFAATVAVGLAAGLLAAASPALAKPNGPKPNKPPKPAKPSVTINPTSEAAPTCGASASSPGVVSRIVISADGTTAVLRIRGTQADDTIVAAAEAAKAENVAALGSATVVRVVVHGYRGDDLICGLPNVANRIYGLGGKDTLIGGDKTDALFGGTGNDKISGATPSEPDKVVPGAGQDTVWVVAGSRVNGKVVPTP